jgi:putative peptidoglycan lipid II flippase
LGGAAGPDDRDGPGGYHAPYAAAGAETGDRSGPGRTRRQQRRTSRLNRFLGVVGAALLLVGATLVGLQLMLSAFDSPDPGAEGPTPTETSTDDPSSPEPDPDVEPTPLELVAADYFDPFGSTPENPNQVGAAIDGDASTSWTTLNYYDPLERQKDGVGLFVDLGDDQVVTEIQLTLLNADSDVELMVAPEGSGAAPTELDTWNLVHRQVDTDETLTHTLDEAVTTRFVLVWFTRLPVHEGNYRSGIAEVSVLGADSGGS